MRLLSEVRGMVTGVALVALVLVLAVALDVSLLGLELVSSLRFHMAVALLAFPLAFFILRAWWRGLLMLAIILASLGQSASVVMRQQETRALFAGKPAVASLDMVSFNVLAFNDEGERIATYLGDNPPDVLLVMEANGVSRQLDELNSVFPYSVGCGANEACDILLMSRTPLIDARVTALPPLHRYRLATAKTEIGGQVVNLVGIHLTKPYFDGINFEELRVISQALGRLEGPLVLAGDFNAAAWSGGVNDFVRANSLVPPPLYPATWPVELGALGVPIDNMFSRGGALIEEIETLPEAFGSNHMGLRAQIAVTAP